MHSTSKKLSDIGKYRAVDKFTTEALFHILPTIMDFILAVVFAANRFGFHCAFKVTLTGLRLILFLLWSSRRTARLEKTRSDAKDYIENFRYGRQIGYFCFLKDTDRTSDRGDLIGSYHTIQIQQKEATATADHDAIMCKREDPENKLIDWSSTSDIAQEVVFSPGLYLLIRQAITGVLADNVKSIDISAFYALAIQLQKRLSTLGDSFRRMLRYWVLGCRAFDLIEEKPTTADVLDAVDLLSCQGNVQFQNVEFAYSTTPVLSNLSFDCRPGETVVFVGKSGAWKSTIWNLIFRNY
jgi:ABC-type multidrug transport system fused ATPase/permease subunit